MQVGYHYDANHYKFTGKERDTETGLDYFEARYYASNMGRWMSPDWADKPADVPYAEFGDPQSLNLYGYVRNHPISQSDPDGHTCADPITCGAEGGAVIGSFFEPGGGTVIGAILGAAVGGVIGYYGGRAIANHINQSEDANADKGSQPAASTPTRTANDELPRDANGRPVPDAEAQGAAHTQLGIRQSRKRPGTSYPQSREFDANGNEVKTIDHTNHPGLPGNHPNPHEHKVDPETGKRGPALPVQPTPPPPPQPKTHNLH